MFNPAMLAGQIKQVAAALESIVPVVPPAGSHVAQHTLDDSQRVLSGISNVADGFAKADQPNEKADKLDRALGDLNGVVSMLATLPLPPQAVLPLRVASILLPVLESSGYMLIQQIQQRHAAGPPKTTQP